jgi:hypothetical protein
VSVHIEVVGSLHVAAPPADAFRFFTPDGERLYVPGWDPEYLDPPDGALVEGLTFRTHHNGEETLWLVSRCAAPCQVDYVRVTPGSRIGVVSVRLTADGEAGSDVSVAYRMTSLSPAGERTLDAFAAAFPEYLSSWERSIGALVDVGQDSGPAPAGHS